MFPAAMRAISRKKTPIPHCKLFLLADLHIRHKMKTPAEVNQRALPEVVKTTSQLKL